MGEPRPREADGWSMINEPPGDLFIPTTELYQLPGWPGWVQQMGTLRTDYAGFWVLAYSTEDGSKSRWHTKYQDLQPEFPITETMGSSAGAPYYPPGTEPPTDPVPLPSNQKEIPLGTPPKAEKLASIPPMTMGLLVVGAVVLLWWGARKLKRRKEK